MPDLYPEDQKRVEEYLSSNVHKVVREPFNPIKLLAIISIVLTLLTLISFWIAAEHGVL